MDSLNPNIQINASDDSSMRESDYTLTQQSSMPYDKSIRINESLSFEEGSFNISKSRYAEESKDSNNSRESDYLDVNGGSGNKQTKKKKKLKSAKLGNRRDSAKNEEDTGRMTELEMDYILNKDRQINLIQAL